MKYNPVPIPQEGSQQYLDQELHRISSSVNDLDDNKRDKVPDPYILRFDHSQDDVTYSPTASWERLFVGWTPDGEEPAGAWDSVNGELVVPSDGIYQIFFSLNASGSVAGTGNRTHSCGIRFLKDGAGDGTVMQNSCANNFPMSVSINHIEFWPTDCVLTFEAYLIEEQFTDVVTVTIGATVLKISGV